MPFLSGSLPTLHRAEVLQAEVVLAVHHDGPGGRQTELGSGAARGGRRLLRRRTFLFFLFLHLVIHQAMLDLQKREGETYLFMKIGGFMTRLYLYFYIRRNERQYFAGNGKLDHFLEMSSV